MCLKITAEHCENMLQAEKQLVKKKQSQPQQQQQKKNYIFNNGHRPEFNLIFICFCLLLKLQKTVSQSTAIDTYYYVGCFTERTDLFKESVYAKAPLTCIDICQHQNYGYAILSGDHCFCSNQVYEQERQDEQLCNTRCLANKDQYCGGTGMHSYYSTSRGQQPAVNHLAIVNATENSLLIAWQSFLPGRVYISGGAEAPLPMNTPKIVNFFIRLNRLHSYSAMPFYAAPEFIVQNTETRFEINDLHPASEYNISVSAICEQGNVCGAALVQGSTQIGQPFPSPPQPKILSQKGNKIEVEIPILRNDNGPLTKVLVIVERVDDALSQPFDTSLLSDWKKAEEDGLPYYIAAELDYDRPEDNRIRRFLVGDGKRYGRFVNMPLEGGSGNDNQNLEDAESEIGAHYHVSLGVVSSLNGLTKTLYTRGSHEQHSGKATDEFTYGNFESGSQSIIALTVICVLFGSCLVLSILTYFYLRYKSCQVRANGINRLRNGHEMSLQQPIIERENNGFVVEDELPSAENFKHQLNGLVEGLEPSKRLPRNALRMNINDVLVEGRYGEVITGNILTQAQAALKPCQLHVLSLDDLSKENQAHLLRDFQSLMRLGQHDHILDFCGISSSADWFYMVFAHEQVSLKYKLVESRIGANSLQPHRLSGLSEELVLQWIYELSSALAYLNGKKVIHKHLCSHNVFVSNDAKLKLSIFGNASYANHQQKVDLTRWLAPEALRFQHYSSSSDVWAFACVAWECCALGGTPYADINSNQHILDALRNGARPAQPAYVYADLYQLFLNCWQLEPSERIQFEEICFSIRQLMTSPRHALSFDRTAINLGANHTKQELLPAYLPMLEVLHQQ